MKALTFRRWFEPIEVFDFGGSLARGRIEGRRRRCWGSARNFWRGRGRAVRRFRIARFGGQARWSEFGRGDGERVAVDGELNGNVAAGGCVEPVAGFGYVGRVRKLLRPEHGFNRVFKERWQGAPQGLADHGAEIEIVRPASVEDPRVDVAKAAIAADRVVGNEEGVALAGGELYRVEHAQRALAGLEDEAILAGRTLDDDPAGPEGRGARRTEGYGLVDLVDFATGDGAQKRPRVAVRHRQRRLVATAIGALKCEAAMKIEAEWRAGKIGKRVAGRREDGRRISGRLVKE